MLTLTGTVRAATTLGGGVNKKTGEVIQPRSVLQVEGLDSRGLVQLYTLTVPDLTKYADQVGSQISVPVRAWAPGATVNLSYEEKK
ncbi:hypothetical protein HMPREF2843_11390 [Staphylococcus sp. HMSC067B04]|jgi:hypothetical protein|uniref:hypothetical protein n=1 Tax=Bacteria TaxID=2 RepID=UPI0006C41D7B|nr:MULTISPECIES: hypothetical protein [Bacteria]KOR28947.1 hypothetical protein TI04_09820 [Achromatium sp. WMS2]OFR34768.1 hypothetical protein HMPREF2889_10320 [Staphylococcus sp. HMSC063F02]OFK10685.1 hypothetical protein HMPREF2830_04835 [Pseudomonas aeruginosa]OFK55677.1 hypothetical protein HMPREF2813_08450 [Haemophilus sp. HMSC066A11]OFL00007.1 hypothetical protein HMPREF2790_23595 [Pseudomonas aeruginosa]